MIPGVEAPDEELVGPIRGELLGVEHLAARARAVARDQRLVSGRRPLRSARLLARLADTRRILRDAHRRLVAAAATGVDAGSAAEWLLDNYYVLQEQLQQVRATLPGGYYRELPELANGPLAGYPRVYEVAISLISHTEARVDQHNVDRFVEAFQEVTPLSIGELWALPAMLRLGLIESVRRLTLRTVQRLDEVSRAVSSATRIIAASTPPGTDLPQALRDFVAERHALSPHFVSRFLQTLRPAEGSSPAMAWLEHWLRESGVSPEDAVARSTQRLALTQLMMANSITSLREVGQRDWRIFVEHHSALEATLRTDPSGFYSRMTFETRDRYRHVVEGIAKRTGHTEVGVAAWAIELAERARIAEGQAATHRAHVGFYLIDDGLASLEGLAGYTPPAGQRVERLVRAHPDVVFFGGLALCASLMLVATLVSSRVTADAFRWWMFLLLFLPALDAGSHLLGQLITTLLPPTPLPRLDLQGQGVPAEYRTVVVIPTLFGSVDEVHAALDNLEVQFLASREAHLHFAVLSDFTDAAQEVEPGDAAIIAAATAGIRDLNERHAAEEGNAFHLFHRPRRWNEQQGVWMGWERKRGKLWEFNRLLRGMGTDAFAVIGGDPAPLREVKYVITLDADTVLPPDAAPALIGALAHPLNRAVFDDAGTRVVRGYGILQPRVGVSLPSANRTRFATVASGHPGVDPYTTAVSDVYQDLFGEGSFTGKGIYDVDTFQRATRGRFPENTLLSHDLIEGHYARAGLVADVIVYDDYPSRYVGYARRKHRWIRGDWQLLPWLRSTVPGPGGPVPNRLSLVSRWKIIDNLRRSTAELSQLLLLLAAWTVLPGSRFTWTVIGLAAIGAPWVISLLLAAVNPPRRASWRAYYLALGQDVRVSAQQWVMTLASLPHQGWVSADAIGRTLYRLTVSRRHLLEWHSASLVERSLVRVRAECRRATRGATVIAPLVAVAVTGRDLASGSPPGVAGVIVMWSIVLLWLAAPHLLGKWSTDAAGHRRALPLATRDVALRFARRHWGYFDQFVTAESHWLAPDNFQSDPVPVVAQRTSPTNIGLQLLATVSAHDLGCIPTLDMTERLERAFATLATLRRFRGHFYNWYDLRDLRVLDPAYVSTVDSGNLAGHLIALRQALLHVAAERASLRDRLHALARQAQGLVDEMDFSFLYDPTRKLLRIGYHPDSSTGDAACYDMLASEARLASFIAIARKDVPLEHWFRLGRSLRYAAGGTTLVSWSGSMFEYLMPVLVMRAFPFTLLASTYRQAVQRHVAHGRARGVPWGVSECAYNVRDREQTYQYRAFGVAELALQRGLDRETVVAPYASALAMMVDPREGMANLERLTAMGALGKYGFRDALDYTRTTRGEPFALVHTYMAHHVGMSLVAMTNVLCDDIWPQRFHTDPLVKAVELLLFERVPRALVVRDTPESGDEDNTPAADRTPPQVRAIDTSEPSTPRVALLGSQPYTVMLNHNGSGYSNYQSLAVTRWRRDATCDDVGQFCYVAQVNDGRTWSTARQPMGVGAERSRASFFLDRAVLRRRDGDIVTLTEIAVVPADAAEVRRVTLTNSGSAPQDIELTSYGEVVLAPMAADRAHPAFSNLFVETEWHEWCTALTATRRPRGRGDQRLWLVHVLDAGADRVGRVTCESDRARFVGRGRSVRNPRALDAIGGLSGTTGAVLDPIVALRTRLRVEPGRSVSASFTTLVATSRAAAFELADRYHGAHAAQRAFDLAWTSTQIELAELGITAASASAFQDIATQLLYRGGSLAPPNDEVRRNRGTQPRLWSHGVSGDRPIVLATITSLEGLPSLRELFTAHRYWRRRGLTVDLVVVNAHPHDYLQSLRDGISDAMVATSDAVIIDQPGGVFVRRHDVFQPGDLLMLSATARIHVACDGRSLARILASADSRRHGAHEAAGPAVVASPTRQVAPLGLVEALGSPLQAVVSVLRPIIAPLAGRPDESTSPGTTDGRSRRARETSPHVASSIGEAAASLHLHNGIGGLDAAGNYSMVIDPSHLPPAPWSNVIANQRGGFVVTERGTSCTWAENAHFYRLTPWHNDPTRDPASDVLFLTDRDSGEHWSATPAPTPGAGSYRVSHAPGRSTFTHQHAGIVSELQVGMSPAEPAKLSLLRLTNQSSRPRRLALTAYVEWTLAADRDQSQHHVRTRWVAEHRAIFAQNHFDHHFTEWTACLSTSEPVASHSGDRLAFIGRDGTIEAPIALDREGLDGATGVALDPCAALQVAIDLAPGESRQVSVVLAAAATDAALRAMLEPLRTSEQVQAALDLSVREWEERLGVLTVHTPDRATNALLNRWSLYQTIACRLWARAAFYQSSGAYGFRDQLQDVLACLYAEPSLARQHILRAAARQFVEGDVQHWWHAHSGRGVRTRFSDDLAWLPFAVDRYVRVTGDVALLSEEVPFIEMRHLAAHEAEIYDLPTISAERGSVYEHCIRALHRACTRGAHGLPLIGTGDWNDGLSEVGAEGRGESVWLAWFLSRTLRDFAAHARDRHDAVEGELMERHAGEYEAAAEAHGWDGAWYRRAYYDDGTPLGSATSDECRIDAIAQSWSVISGAASLERQGLAMRALETHLVDDDARLLPLLTPPFDAGQQEPGYIKGYLPGVRENGAQYTHAAVWTVLATAMRGDGDRAFALFQMLNPFTRSATPGDVETYKVEPYAVAADIYTARGLVGRGGWTWYTGSAGWLYRVGIESLLGFQKVGDTLRIIPCVPTEWSEYRLVYRFGSATYDITVRPPARHPRIGTRVTLDGTSLASGTIPLIDDGTLHLVLVEAAE